MDWATALGLIAGASSFLKKPAEDAFGMVVKDAYSAVKTHLKKAFKKSPDAIDALEKVEARPDSKGRQEYLLEEVGSYDLAKDDQLLELLRMLEVVLKQAGVTSTQTISIQQTGTGNRANVAGRDIIITEKKTVRPVVKPNASHVTDSQAKLIQDKVRDISRIDEKAGKGSSYGELYGSLKGKFKCTSYRTIPAEYFAVAMSWLDQEKGKRTRSLRRTDNAEWRKAKYKIINASANTLGWERDYLYEFATRELGLKKALMSLKDLKERQLDKLAEKLRYLSKSKR